MLEDSRLPSLRDKQIEQAAEKADAELVEAAKKKNKKKKKTKKDE